MQYIIITALLFVLELLYFRIADKFDIIDKPNSRSSHTQITLRGGGIIFPIAVMVAYFFGFVSLWVTIAIVIVAIISFIDDIKPLPNIPRLAIHIAAALLIFYDLKLLEEAWWLIPIMLLFLLSWVNAFNFMDGINGITVLFSMVTLLTFAILPQNSSELPLLISIISACLVFGFFNFRKKAKTFAGDVGSISLAMLISYLMINTMIKTNQIAYVLFFATYGIDAFITIINRMIKKENIFDAHRSHLYQYMANEYGMSHLVVSCWYAVVQIIINIFLIYMHNSGQLSLLNASIFVSFLIFSYLLIRRSLLKKIRNKAN